MGPTRKSISGGSEPASVAMVREFCEVHDFTGAQEALKKLLPKGSCMGEDFVCLAKFIMSLETTNNKEMAGKARLQQILANVGEQACADFLCSLNIVDSCIQMLNSLHCEELDRTGRNENIILTIWDTIRSVSTKSKDKGVKAFLEHKHQNGLQLMIWYTGGKYPIKGSLQLQRIMEELTKLIEPAMKLGQFQNDKWTSRFETIKSNLKRIA